MSHDIRRILVPFLVPYHVASCFVLVLDMFIKLSFLFFIFVFVNLVDGVFSC